MHPDFQIVRAPARPSIPENKTVVFLAGTNTTVGSELAGPLPQAQAGPDSEARDWREVLGEALKHLPVTVINPLRPDWDDTWRDDDAGPDADVRFVEQTHWEFDMQRRADIGVLWFGKGAMGAVSMMELGLAVGRQAGREGGANGGIVVGCEHGFWKRGNVMALCRSTDITMCATFDELVRGTVEMASL